MPGPYGVVPVSHRPVNALYADFAGKYAGVAGFVVDDETAVGVHIGGDACARRRR